MIAEINARANVSGEQNIHLFFGIKMIRVGHEWTRESLYAHIMGNPAAQRHIVACWLLILDKAISTYRPLLDAIR